MNGAVARKIRKSVFGDYSPKHREYGVLGAFKEGIRKLLWPEERVKLTDAGQVLCLGLRSRYRATKKGYKSMKRMGIKNPLAILLKK